MATAAGTVEHSAPTEVVARPDAVSSIIKGNSLYAAASGLIPVPALDIAANTAVQVRMVAQLCDEYGVRFSEQAVKSIIAALLASTLPRAAIGYSVFSLAKGVPLVGPLLGIATMPALNFAVTWAVGRVFAWHFSQGGNLENIDTGAMSDKFSEEMEKGKAQAAAAVGGKK